MTHVPEVEAGVWTATCEKQRFEAPEAGLKGRSAL